MDALNLNQVPGGVHGGLRIGGGIRRDPGHRLSKHTATGIDVADRQVEGPLPIRGRFRRARVIEQQPEFQGRGGVRWRGNHKRTGTDNQQQTDRHHQPDESCSEDQTLVSPRVPVGPWQSDKAHGNASVTPVLL